MKLKNALILIFICCLWGFQIISVFGQFSDDFSDGDMSINPTWQGNTENFITNTDYQLQLDAFEAGESILYTHYNISDSMEWNIYFKMDFSPSVSNKLKVYLMTDKVDLTLANGYFLEIGENGNNDNLKFYKIKNGQSTLIAQGETGKFAEEPAESTLKIQKDIFGTWKFFYKNDQNYFIQDFEVSDNEIKINDGYFILQCFYTATRKDKFVFDNISATEYAPDKDGPKLIEANLIDAKTLNLIFDEELEEVSVLNYNNYNITGTDLKPLEIVFDNNFKSQLTLKYNNPFESGREYEIEISGIEDKVGNIAGLQKSTFFVIDKPQKGDLVINEILFNPNTGGSDFVEILNNSNKIIDLNGLKISNLSIDKGVLINKKIIVKHNDYICLTKDSLNISINYFIPDSVRFIQLDLPSFNDDEGNVSILQYQSQDYYISIDSFDYNEDMHSGFLDDNEGISLERINPDSKTNDKYNWSSASVISGGATPGYKNSGFYQVSGEDSGVFLAKKIFSPDNDGIDDELVIEYNLEKENYLMNCKVIDFKGRNIIEIMNNITIGNEGLIKWNGYNDGKQLPIGIYLFYYNLIDESGNKKEGKIPFILAQKLN